MSFAGACEAPHTACAWLTLILLAMSDKETATLKQANDNPWYCLATLYGEQPIDSYDHELAEKNRLAWGQWFADNTSAAVSAVQSVSGAVLLFLLGLALRNRFRMK